MKSVVELAIMYANGTLPEQFQTGEVTPNDALRAGVNKILGLDADNKVVDKKILRQHKVELFALLEEILQKTVHEGSLGVLEDWAVEYRNLQLGDTNVFKVPDNELFRVSVISDGNGNIQRQRLREGEEFTVKTDILAVKIYEEFVRWYSGRVDFLEMIDKAGKSMVKEIKSRVHDAILKTFRAGGSSSEYRVTISSGTGVPQEDKILEVAKHLEAKTGVKPVVVGSALALYKANPKYMTEADKEVASRQGFVGRIAGLDCIEIAPTHKEGTEQFTLADNELFIIPQTDEKFIKVVNEGEAYIIDNTETTRADLQSEYLLTQRVGIAVVAPSEYAYVKFT